MNNHTDETLKKVVVSQPSSRKSRSISRYFLGNKRSSIDGTTQDNIFRCLVSVGIFDSYDLWTNVTLFRDYTTCRRLFILTTKNELIIGKYNQRQSIFKIKHRIDLNRVWLYANINDSIASEITSLNYYDHSRSLIIGWPLAENFIVEFDTKSIREIWKQRIESTLRSWWQLNDSNIEHVRIVIDQNYESDQNNNTASFLIRKVVGIRPQETVHDLIKKCIEAFHLQDPSVDSYVLFATNNQSNPTVHTNPNSSSQSTQITNIPLIGHEYPYSIKMKHLKYAHATFSNNRSFDGDDHLSCQTHHTSSSTSLNNVTITSCHDFELRKRDTLSENQTRKHRFFHKRKTKTQQQLNDDYHSPSTPYLSSPNQTKIYFNFFGRTPDELIQRYNHQLPPVIMQLLEVLYLKGPDTTGIFRKVANARSVKDCIEKIERNIPLQDDDLHPILAAGLLKHFLRTLPEPLFNSIQYDNWKKCLRLSTSIEKVSFARKNILITLSEAKHILLKGFICILHRISQNADTNGMNPFNLGLCVSNSLFKTESTTITSGKQEADVMSSIVEFLIQNCSSLFGSDILTCITDKRINVHQMSNITRPAASSIESLDEVESSPHLPIVNRSHDSGLAASDQPFNDDSSEISEHFRRNIIPVVAPTPDWSSSIVCGKGIVLTSIITNNTNSSVTTLSITRRRSSKNTYKPSKQFLEREKLTNNTTDDSDNNSSKHSSATTIHNITIGKIKRSKSLSRHSSLGSGEQKQTQKYSTKESRRLTSNNVKRTSSLKQFHHSSDEAGDDDDDEHKNILANERRTKLTKPKANNNKKTINDESITIRSTASEQQDLDLTSEPLSTINQRLTSSIATPTRSASFILTPASKKFDVPITETTQPVHSNTHQQQQQQPIIAGSRSRHTGPLSATTNKVYLVPQPAPRYQHLGQTNSSKEKPLTTTERGRTFVHRADSRPFVLGAAIQMKPIDDLLSSNEKRRPCHRQNALRYKSNEQERQSRISAPVIISYNQPPNVSRYQSIERRLPSSPQQPIKTFSFDINNEFRSSDISWSVREKAKLFEHTNQHKLSTGRENYV
ncbi:unnamed protein product [Rotaria socialis]|uniref:Rho-GAP domain-containing protein n=1 Tax=Rotaria socialis TaxID=392032 RepID=A0A821P445_9BILA|nr:unnamed protein product [Rotaria socialis]CAF4798360.1 unnamed protein product [Rotaria socialis]